MTVSSNPKLDTFYLLYFLIHIPITVLVDSALVIPPAYRLAIQTKVLNFHISENKDFILLLAPSWLKVAGFVELIFQLPVFFIGIYALWNDIKKFYPLLMTYGFNASLTTLFCLYDIYIYNNGSSDLLGFTITQSDRLKLFWVYFPTFLIPLVMFIDLTIRITKMLSNYQELQSQKKEN
ncbi:Ema19 protein [Saccharomycopsis crataegensis]|uniref:Efficient mitochondria targeting-associated protein 19 n=1 Tax=Saccharomycopsis crataegensis TaxID=43959 RepID=A0AAV5QJD2_9ASCO|nr:Ema19 protein [Saccharomycopsis crataegensis]